MLLISSGFSLKLSGQNIEKLPRSIPELQGISSSGIIDFLNAIDTGRQEIHSFMFLRQGKVIAEGWWNPYGPDFRHLMYSASKTFTATAIGLAVTEGRLKLTDKVVSFFPYSLPDTIGNNMKELTVQNLLTMSVGQDPPANLAGIDEDWITAFIRDEPVHKPGTVFKYNNMATFMLSAIIQQVTGNNPVRIPQTADFRSFIYPRNRLGQESSGDKSGFDGAETPNRRYGKIRTIADAER